MPAVESNEQNWPSGPKRDQSRNAACGQDDFLVKASASLSSCASQKQLSGDNFPGKRAEHTLFRVLFAKTVVVLVATASLAALLVVVVVEAVTPCRHLPLPEKQRQTIPPPSTRQKTTANP